MSWPWDADGPREDLMKRTPLVWNIVRITMSEMSKVWQTLRLATSQQETSEIKDIYNILQNSPKKLSEKT